MKFSPGKSNDFSVFGKLEENSGRSTLPASFSLCHDAMKRRMPPMPMDSCPQDLRNSLFTSHELVRYVKKFQFKVQARRKYDI